MFRTRKIALSTSLAIGCAAAALTLAAAPSIAHTDDSMTAATPAAKAPLIPRESLFGNPTRAGGQISPDGKWISWLAPSNGVLNVWMAPADDLDNAKVMTKATDRPIRQYFWAPDSASLLYIQDKGGDENFLLYGVNVETGVETTLTDFENTRVMVVGGSDRIKDKILIGLNNRDPQYHDVYMLDLNTGELTELIENNGYAGFVADDNLDVRLALKPNAEGGMDFFKVVDNAVEEEPFGSTGLEDSLTTSPAGFTTDGKTLYWLDSRGRNTAALTAMDVETGETRVIAQDEKADIGGSIRDQKTGEVEAYSVYYLKNEWVALDPEIKASLDFLEANLTGE